jgi:hypothetical protein
MAGDGVMEYGSGGVQEIDAGIRSQTLEFGLLDRGLWEGCKMQKRQKNRLKPGWKTVN